MEKKQHPILLRNQRRNGRYSNASLVRSTISFFLSLLISLSNSICVAQPAPLTPTDPQWHFRYELFQLLLQKRGLQVSTKFNDAFVAPNDSVIVLVGDLQKVSTATWENLRGFLSNGGNLLVATDSTSRVLGLGNLGIGTVNVGPVWTANERDSYEGFTDCLRVHEFNHDHPLTVGLDEIVTNRSGWLSSPVVPRGDVAKWQVIASLPENSQPLTSKLKPLIAIYQDSKAQSGKGIVVADASLFTNSMLWHADNGLLSIRIADSLCNSNRSRLVYMVDGMAKPRYESTAANKNESDKTVSNPKSQTSVTERKPSLENLLRFANMATQRVADSNIVNEFLKNQPRNVNKKEYFRWIWGMSALFAATLMVLMLLRKTSDLAPFLNSRNMRSLHDMRTVAQHPLDKNSFAAECLARDFCRQWVGKDLVSDWQHYLQDLDLEPRPIPMTNQERAAVRNIIELGVYGKKSFFTDEQLENLGIKIRHLLVKLSTS